MPCKTAPNNLQSLVGSIGKTHAGGMLGEVNDIPDGVTPYVHYHCLEPVNGNRQPPVTNCQLPSVSDSTFLFNNLLNKVEILILT